MNGFGIFFVIFSFVLNSNFALAQDLTPKTKLQLEQIVAALPGLLDRIKNLEDANKVLRKEIPLGAVVAFDLPDGCPKQGWTQLEAAKGRFLIGVDGKKYRLPYEAGTPHYQLKGEERVWLSSDEMPSHNHPVSAGYDNKIHDALGGSSAHYGIQSTFDPNAPAKPSFDPSFKKMIGPAGKGDSHNNMPPYIPLYFCKKD